MRAEARLLGRLVAVALALTLPGAAFALEFGTFFHTPEERSRLDRLRRGEAEIPVAAPGRTGGPAVTGYVQRSDGHNTLWIDGRPVATSNPRAAPLFDPRKVRDDRMPESVIRPSELAPKTESR